MDLDSDRYERSEIEALFRDRMAKEDLARLLAREPPLGRSCEEIRASVLFFDVHGFTRLMDETEPKVVFERLSALSAIILSRVKANNGYYNLTIGDASLVLFGAPLHGNATGDAIRACQTALEVLALPMPEGIKIGAGINTGIVYLGSTSALSIPDYTPIGDTVNVASRMEGVSRIAGDRLVVGEETRNLVDRIYRCVFVDWSHNRTGLREPAAAYAIAGERARISGAENSFWDRYDAASELLKDGNNEDALAAFEALNKERPADGLMSTQVDRARRAYAASLSSAFEKAHDLGDLLALATEASSRLVPNSSLAILEPYVDGMWRFSPESPLVASPLALAPEGDSLAWLRGLAGPTTIRSPYASKAAVSPPPEPLASSGFELYAPLRFRNELTAVLAFALPEGSRHDPTAIGILASSLASPLAERRETWTRERYREKIDDAMRLEEVNRELEAKSSQLEKALAEIRSLNMGLEAKVREGAERLERAATLKRYLPSSVVEEILEGRRDLEPRLERRKITVLFSDIHGFTSATDAIEPEELSRLLNEYLSAMSAIAFAYGATIDKFRGDGMMVFFGAPEPLAPADGAKACLKMAVAMCREIEALRSRWFAAGYDWDLGVRMGVNTGYATVGEFGCTERMDYTAIGTEVNLASRLETACDTDAIVVSHSTWALIHEDFPCRPMGEVNLKGIHRPVKVYSVEWREATREEEVTS